MKTNCRTLLLQVLFLHLISACFISVSFGQADSTIILKEGIIITAQRMAAAGNAVAESVVTQDRDEIVRLSPISTPDAMAAMAGVWMQKTNHGGGSPFIRGLTGYQTLLLIDGLRFNNSTFRSGPNQYLNTIDPFALQRIEVLRGQGSVQYGSDGIGGVAQLFFREPEFVADEKLQATGRLYASFMDHDMEYAGRAELELGSSNFALLGGMTYKKLGDIHAGGDLGTLQNTGYDEQSWDIKTKTKISNMYLTAAWQHLVQKDVPLYHQLESGSYSRYHFSPQQRDLGYVRLQSYFKSKIFSEVTFTVAYLNSLEKREKQRTSSPVTRYERDNVDTYHAGADVVSNFTSRWKSVTGIELYHDRIESSAMDTNQDTNESNASRGLYPDGTTYLNVAAFSIHTIDLDRLELSLGARYNFLRMQVNDPVFGATEVKPDATVGNVGLVFNVSKSIQLIASANTGFRAPNVNDVASFGVADYRYEVPNYALGPEKSFQYQAGVRVSTDKFTTQVFVYRNHLKDLISNVSSTYNGQDSLDGFKVYKKENVNKAEIKGVEAEFQYQPLNGLTAFANATYTVGDNITRDEPLGRIPPFFGKAGVDLEFLKRLTWRVEFIGASKQDRLSSGDKADSRIAAGGTPGWTVLNTRIQYSYGKFCLNTGIQNIFDTAYRVHGSGVDGIGRSFWASLIVELSSNKKK
ncbi:MAG: colicin I receptor [Marivirga sp.]|nr:colicin I receptor [Marivirga sp.]